jgi:hypothetical protein
MCRSWRSGLLRRAGGGWPASAVLVGVMALYGVFSAGVARVGVRKGALGQSVWYAGHGA